MKFVQESTAFKLLVEPNGVLVSLTTKNRAFFFFASSGYFGMKVAPTTDPDLGIVELCNYDIAEILRNWDRLWRVKVKRDRRAASSK